MGGKARTPDIVALAKELRVLQSAVARQQVLAANANAMLAESKTALTATRSALVAAATNKEIDGSTIPALTASTRRRAVNKGKARRAKPRSAKYWQAAQERMIKAMKKGTMYDSSELQQLAGCGKEAKHRFQANVRARLLTAKKIKKTLAEKGNRSPRNVRWVLA